MLKKLFLISVVSLFLILCALNPVLAGERKVLGLNFPLNSGVCYEHESAENQSWLISGAIYTDGSFLDHDITFSCYSGKRFYSGDESGRFYSGFYGSGFFVYIEPGHCNYGVGAMGVLGYEYRFGATKNLRIFVEGGLDASVTCFDWFSYGPAWKAGMGVNI